MQRHDFRTQRLYCQADLAAGKRIEANRAQANYLLNVLRLKKGGSVLVFNGRDGEWLAEIDPVGRKDCALAVIRQTRGQPGPGDLWYLFAPLKQARLDYMVQKAVEMGTSVLAPVITQHTQVSRVNGERMRANAIEAAEQCGVLALPEIRTPARLDAVLSCWPSGRHLVFCDEATSGNDPLELLRPLAGSPLAVLIGPEGGFSQTERDMLCALPFVTAIALGPRILRADTAAVAALAIVQAACGDWAQGGGDIAKR